MAFPSGSLVTALQPYASACPQGYRPQREFGTFGKYVCVPASQPQPMSVAGIDIDPTYLLIAGGALVLILLLGGKKR